MKYKTKNELLIKQMNNYLKYLNKLRKDNPETSKREATKALIRIGIIDKNNNLKPPYNGEKVNENDFEYGPKSKVLKK